MTNAVRFAPSPTGLLHVGNIRAAIYNWLLARRTGGSFMLRLDDTDTARSKPEYAMAIEEDLGWLGLRWDRFARQSDRMGRYAEMAELLKGAGRLYPCFETPEELALKRKVQLARSLPPLYDRAALALADSDRAAFVAQGRKPHWRFRLDHAPVTWDDLIQGPKHFEGSALSDPVLIREDGVPLYTFASIVDDVDFGITHVIRGEDHVANTAVQIQIWKAVAALAPGNPPVCAFAHFPLFVSATGEEMSKRLGTLSVRSLREEMGLEPMAVASLLARLGTSEAVEPCASLDDLVAGFDLAHVSRATPKFDPAELKRLNAKVLHLTPYARVADRLKTMGVADMTDGATESFWNAVRPVITTLAEAKDWWDVVRQGPASADADPAFLEQAADTLPPPPWNHDTWQLWIGKLKAATGLGGKNLFMPLRLALTGREHGPELQALLPLMGYDSVRARLLRQKAA